MHFLNLMVKKYYVMQKKYLPKVAQELACKEYNKFKVKQDKLYKSDFDNFLNKARMIENGSDK